jgi:hypothetical protein
MGRCATCGKHIGWFGGRWRRLDGEKHCLDCAPGVMAQRRQATREALLAGSAPQVVLAAPVISRDLDFPSNNRRYTGAVLLTDKGVVFAQRGEYQKAQSGSAMFGLLGAIFDNVVEKGRRESASAGLVDIDAESAPALVDRAEQLFLFPIGDIRKLKANNSYVEVRSPEVRAVFRWMSPRQSIKPKRLLLDAYVHAVNGGRDVISDCRDLLTVSQAR